MSTVPHAWDVPTQGRNTRDAVAQNVSRNVEEGFLCSAERLVNWNRGLAKHRTRICGVFLGMLCAPTACQSCNVFHRRRRGSGSEKSLFAQCVFERLDQNEGTLVSRVEFFSAPRRSAQSCRRPQKMTRRVRRSLLAQTRDKTTFLLWPNRSVCAWTVFFLHGTSNSPGQVRALSTERVD